MIDMQLQNQCDHKIYELITISGISPNYYTYLENIPNKTRDGVYVGCYTTDSDVASFALQGFNVVGGSNSLVGITNWQFDDNEPTKINFPYDEDFQSVDGNKDILPKLMYVMSYYTTIGNCPKCNGTGIVSDIAFDSLGKIKTVTGYGKVKQQLLKILLTVIGDNLYDSNYGSQISNSIGQKFTTYTSANIQYSIYKAVQHLIQIQQENNLPANETIAELSNITLDKTNDPRKIKLSINVITEDAQEISASLTFNLQ